MKKEGIVSLAQRSSVDKFSPRGIAEQRRWENAWLKEETKIIKLRYQIEDLKTKIALDMDRDP